MYDRTGSEHEMYPYKNRPFPTFRPEFRPFVDALVDPIMLDPSVVLNFAIDGVWINSLDDFGERFREKSVSQLL